MLHVADLQKWSLVEHRAEESEHGENPMDIIVHFCIAEVFNAGDVQCLTPNTYIIWDTGGGRFLLTYSGSPSLWKCLVHVDLLK